MERESFEDEEVAEVLNNHYISIKVDREERPDIDQIYMSYCQATTGSGGWPLSVFITSEKKPFYSGTYFPKKSRHGMNGFMDILNAINDKWCSEREDVEAVAERMTYMLDKMSQPNEIKALDEGITNKAFSYFLKGFDETYGGFGTAPKFPTPHNLLFLLRYHYANKSHEALEMVEKTLEQIYKGGIFDHIGFGFSRYSTDPKWLVPHFEKMLYDNALLLMAYVETYQVTQKPFYKEVGEKIITYILRDMIHPKGGFYCAEDADSEGVEGKFYVWSKKEVLELLGQEDGELYCKYYDITKQGNFEGENIPNLIQKNIEVIESNPALKEKLRELAVQLFDVREKRIHPYKDDKILTAWNGLMIAGLSMAGKIFENPDYIKKAEDAIHFIEDNLFREDGRLMSRYREGEVKNLGFLEDYAYLLWAYIELYEAGYKTEYLKSAVKLADDMIRIFEDEKNGGFYLYGSDSEQLITKPKEIYDGALPSGNSIAAYTLFKLSTLTGNTKYEDKVFKIFEYFSSTLKESPMGYTMSLSAYIQSIHPNKEIVIAGKEEDSLLKKMIRSFHKIYDPFAILLVNKEGDDLEKINGFAKNQVAIDGKTTAYVCENFACQKPVSDLEAFKTLIE